MKIDLHCHTRKVKKGDAETREVDCGKFVKELENAQVSIVAITNHNLFDYSQYDEFASACKDKNIQVWPGIELDVKGDKSKGHCIVISNPNFVAEFDRKCAALIAGTNPDKFIVSIEDMINEFKDLDIIVIAHYGWKKPSLVQEDLDTLKNLLQDDKPLFLEVPQLRSAGILYAHNLDSFIGSDIHDWDKYSEVELPELKMPIKDYDHFNLLIKKDTQVLKTFMYTKFNTDVKVSPFDDCTVDIPIFNDINIFFGGKGTGKSSFLKAIKNHFDALGNSDVAYYDGQTKESEYKKLTTVANEDGDFSKLKINDCQENFNKIKEWKDVSITPLNKYLDWASTRDANKLSANFGFKDAVFNETITYKKYEEYKEDYLKITSINNDLEDIKHIDEYLTGEKQALMSDLFLTLIDSSKQKVMDEWINIKSLELEKFTIDKMKSICKTKSGVNQLPSSTGLLSTFTNCKDLFENTEKILSAMDTPKVVEKTKIGTIQEKGSIYLEKSIFVNPNETYLTYKKGATFTKTDLTKVKKLLESINFSSFSYEKGSNIADLNTCMKNKGISSIKDFVGIKGRVINNLGQEYTPSNGEQSMLLLTNAIVDDNKNVYILDEPELSVGHKYINDIIVPRLIELSKLNKTIVVSTHDANIAVRTLPLLSVYREYKGNNRYSTYIGDPFSNNLTNQVDAEDIYDWTERSLNTLEGGEFAFIERGEIYGK